MIKDVGLNRFAVVLLFNLRFLNRMGSFVTTARHLSLVWQLNRETMRRRHVALFVSQGSCP
jgi:hypothetical protein